MKVISGSLLIPSIQNNLKSALGRLSTGPAESPLGMKIGLILDRSPANRFFARREIAVCDALGVCIEPHFITRGGSVAMKAAIEKFNGDPATAGFFFHWPLEILTDPLFSISRLIRPSKDIDGLLPQSRLNPESARLKPGFILAVDKLLRHHNIDVTGKTVCVVGRSDFVGKPLASYFLSRGATVTVCHSRTSDLRRHTRVAQIIVSVAGRPGLIGPEHIDDGSLVIDVGSTLIRKDGIQKIRGDVDQAGLAKKDGWLIPSPGGIRPLVPYMILDNFMTVLGASSRLPRNKFGSLKIAS